MTSVSITVGVRVLEPRGVSYRRRARRPPRGDQREVDVFDGLADHLVAELVALGCRGNGSTDTTSVVGDGHGGWLVTNFVELPDPISR